MSIRGVTAIFFIFAAAASGWFVLGAASELRSHAQYRALGDAVGGLWGEPIAQTGPTLWVTVPGARRDRALTPSANRIDVALRLEQRRKGLIWYPTYVVDFDARYAVHNADAVAQNVRVFLPLPSQSATYERFQVWLDGREIEQQQDQARDGVREIVALAPGETRTLRVGYRTRGLYRWRYHLSPDGGRVRGLDLRVKTNFAAVDFADGSLSPMSIERDGNADGALLRWRAEELITRQPVSVLMPERLNPGPLAARMSFFAPVCLLFFFVLIAAIGILRGIGIHPMHYLFVSGGFFAFHLLFAYLVDLINLHLAFALTSLVSVALVSGYLRAALGPRFPWPAALAGQLFYLVLFSYSFFIDGMTGLTITIGAILTLALLMRLTAKVDWAAVFAAGRKPSRNAPDADTSTAASAPAAP